MRIVHLVRSDAWAGVERHVARLAAEQVRLGHLVTMIGGDPATAEVWLGDRGVDHLAVRTLTQSMRALRQVERPDVLHVHMTAAEVAATLFLPMRGVPVVSTRHFARPRGSGRASRSIAPVLARRVAKQIAVSSYVAEQIEGDSVVIHSGVECVDLPPRRRERVVLLVQRLQPEKSSHVAVEAFAASGLAGEGWRLDVVGDGPVRPTLEQLAGALGVGDAVAFLGHRSDVDDLMASAGMLVAPHDAEGYGLSVVEAMAAALPVVAAGAGGHLETVGRVPDAALFPPGDADAAGRLLRRLAQDASRRDAYGEALRATQRAEFTMTAQAEATNRVYRTVLGTRRSR